MPLRRRPLAVVVLVFALAATIGGSARAAGSGFALGPDVDPSVAAQIANGSAGATYHLLVFGSGLVAADGAAGVGAGDDLGAIGAEGVEATGAQAAALAAQPGVEYVTADVPMVPTGTISAAGAVSASSLSTTYPQVDGATGLWADGVTGSGVGIAVIDSGVTPRADFGDRLVQVRLPGQDASSLDDTVGHGSAVAGVAAGDSPDGQYVGVAPGSTVYAVDVARDGGVYTSDVIAGLDWVLANAAQDDIRVVNLSLQQTVSSSYLTSPLDAAVELLWNAGIVVVASAGNLGPGSEDYAPANDPYLITVGASGDGGAAAGAGDALAGFSSYGTTPDGFAKPEIVAPGMHIVTPLPPGSVIAQAAPDGYLSTDPTDGLGYVRISGTSFAAPQVSGAAALLLQENPALDPDQVKWLLTQSERPVAGSNAGALDLGAVSAADLAEPGSADAGLTPSILGQAGEQVWGGPGAGPLDGAQPPLTTWQDALAVAGDPWDAAAWDAAAWDAAAWDAAAWD